MKNIGTLFLAVALLVPTGATLAAPGKNATQSTADSSATGAVDVDQKETKLTKGFINRATKLCDDLKVEHSLSFIPITLCFIVLNAGDKAESQKSAARAR